MDLYYFHIMAGGHLVIDEEGMLLRDVWAARSEAKATARDLVSANGGDDMWSKHATIEVMNESGILIDSIEVRKCLH